MAAPSLTGEENMGWAPSILTRRSSSKMQEGEELGWGRCRSLAGGRWAGGLVSPPHRGRRVSRSPGPPCANGVYRPGWGVVG